MSAVIRMDKMLKSEIISLLSPRLLREWCHKPESLHGERVSELATFDLFNQEFLVHWNPQRFLLCFLGINLILHLQEIHSSRTHYCFSQCKLIRSVKMEEPTKTICAKYPVHVMKGRQFYKGICISALFFFIVAIHTVRDLGDNYIGADKPTHTLVLNKSIGQMSMREHRAGRGLMEWTSLEEEDADVSHLLPSWLHCW